MTTMQQLAPGQDSPEEPINENFAALAALALWATRAAATTGLTWAWYGGIYGGVSVADGYVTLTASATNYVVCHRGTLTLTASTSATNWNDSATYGRVAKIATGASTVTTIEDHRVGPYGILGTLSPPASATVASAATLTLPQGVRVVTITGNTGITSIDAAGHDGAVVMLVFSGAPTVTDGGNLKLNSNFTASADDTLTLGCTGANWYEGTRSVN